MEEKHKMTEGQKIFVNQTGKDIYITLFIRAGDNPEDEGGTTIVSVAKQGKIETAYEGEPGSLGYVYLNGLLVEWNEGPNMVGVSRKVVQRGDTWDTMLNTNETINISAVAAGMFSANANN